MFSVRGRRADCRLTGMQACRIIGALLCLLSPLAAQMRLLETSFLVRPDLAPGSRAKLLWASAPADLRIGFRAQGREPLECPIVERHPASHVFLLPLQAAVGPGVLTLSSGDESLSLAVRVHPVRFVPQFRADAPAVTAQQDSPGPGTGGLRSNSLTFPALPGDRVLIWGTGLGVRPDPLRMQVEIGNDGPSVPVLSTERLADGRELVEFRIPEATSAPRDCYVPLTLRVDRVPFYAGSISIADERGACPHRLGLATSELQTLDRGGRIQVAHLSLGRSVTISAGPDARAGYNESALLVSQLSNAADVENLTGPLAPPKREGCRVFVDDTYPLFAVSGSANPGVSEPLKLSRPAAETSLELTSQGGFYQWSVAGADLEWDRVPAAAIGSGKWRMTLPAGQHGAGAWEFDVPQPFELTARPVFPAASSSESWVARWDGQQYSDADRVQVTIGFANASRSASCETSAANGLIAVPAGVLLDAGGGTAPTYLSISFTPGAAGAVTRLPLRDGGAAPGILRFWNTHMIGQPREALLF